MSVKDILSHLGEKRGAAGLLSKVKAFELPSLNTDSKVDAFLSGFFGRIGDWVREIICCKGFSQIDSKEERERAAEAITIGIGAAIPAQYKILWPILRPVVKRIVLRMLEDAAKEGAKYCDGVACTLEPLRVNW